MLADFRDRRAERLADLRHDSRATDWGQTTGTWHLTVPADPTPAPEDWEAATPAGAPSTVHGPRVSGPVDNLRTMGDPGTLAHGSWADRLHRVSEPDVDRMYFHNRDDVDTATLRTNDQPTVPALLREANAILRDAADAADDPATADDIRRLIDEYSSPTGDSSPALIPATADAEWEALTRTGTATGIRSLGSVIHYDTRRPSRGRIERTVRDVSRAGTIVRTLCRDLRTRDHDTFDLTARLIGDRTPRGLADQNRQAAIARRVTVDGIDTGTVTITHPDGTVQTISPVRPGRPRVATATNGPTEHCTPRCEPTRHTATCRKRASRVRADRERRAHRAETLTAYDRAHGGHAAARTMM